MSEDQPTKSGPGRPRKGPTKSKSIRLKNEDWQYLTTLASNKGITRNDLFVRMIEALKVLEGDRAKQ